MVSGPFIHMNCNHLLNPLMMSPALGLWWNALKDSLFFLSTWCSIKLKRTVEYAHAFSEAYKRWLSTEKRWKVCCFLWWWSHTVSKPSLLWTCFATWTCLQHAEYEKGRIKQHGGTKDFKQQMNSLLRVSVWSWRRWVVKTSAWRREEEEEKEHDLMNWSKPRIEKQ